MSDRESPTTIAEYLDELVESPVDVDPAAELLPSEDGIQTEQSSDDPEQVAPETDTEQPETPESELIVAEADSSADSEPESPSANWDSQENPYFLQMKAIQQFAEEKQAEAAAAQAKQDEIDRRASWMTGLQSLSETDEDDDRALLAGSLIEDIQKHAAMPVQEEVRVLQHGLTALIAAVESSVDADVLKKIETQAEMNRNLGRTADEIAYVHHVSKQEAAKYDAVIADKNTKIKNLTAQLAAQQIQGSGANRVESIAVGSGGEPELTWESLLGVEPQMAQR